MECLEAIRLIKPYIDNELDPEKEEQFLQHIRTCKSCYDELELNYNVKRSLNQLDSKTFSSTSMERALEENIRRRTERIRAHYRFLTFKYACGTLCFWFLLGTLVLQFRLWLT